MSEAHRAARRYDTHRKRDKPKKDIWLRPLRKDWKRILNRVIDHCKSPRDRTLTESRRFKSYPRNQDKPLITRCFQGLFHARENPILASWQTTGKHFESKRRRRRRPNPGFMVSVPRFPGVRAMSR